MLSDSINSPTSAFFLLLISSVVAVAQHPGEQGRISEEVFAALNSEDSSVRAAAVEQISDQALLAKLVLEDESRQVFYAAFDRLTDQSMLKKVALEHPWARGREFAVMKLTNQQLLAEIAIGQDNQMVRRGAVYRLEDVEVLKTIAVSDRTESIRREAVDRLAKLGVDAPLAEIATPSIKFEKSTRVVENIDEAPLEKVDIAPREKLADPKPKPTKEQSVLDLLDENLNPKELVRIPVIRTDTDLTLLLNRILGQHGYEPNPSGAKRAIDELNVGQDIRRLITRLGVECVWDVRRGTFLSCPKACGTEMWVFTEGNPYYSVECPGKEPFFVNQP